MPVTIHNKKYLLKVLGFKINDAELVRNIENMGPNVKRMNDDEVEVEYTANRPDLISTVGLARAVRHYMRRSRRFTYTIKPGGEETLNVGSHVASIRPYIAAMIVENMALEKEDLLDIINFTEKLSNTYGRQRSKIAMGLHDMRDVEPPFFYDAFEDEEYAPLGTSKKMKYSAVLNSESKGKKYVALCKSGDRYVALKDKKGTMSLIPILNSERTKISTSTNKMLVDVTGSTREVIEGVADLLAADFIDRGYVVRRVKVSYKNKSYSLPKMESRDFSMPLKQLEEEIGVKIGFNNFIVLANKMGHEAALVGRKIRVTVPPYRLDVINEQDIIEDIAVGYGYDYIQPIGVLSTQAGSIEEKTKTVNLAIDVMIGLGFEEAMNSYLTNEDTNFLRMRESKNENYINITNPKSGAATMLRTWLIPSLLKQLGQSMHDKFPLKIFECDMAFQLKNSVPEEKYHIAAVACNSQANFNEIKAVFEGFARNMNLSYEIQKSEHRSFIEGRCARIMLNKRNIGFMGEIHPEVLTSFGIEEPVIGFEIDLDAGNL